MSQFRRKRCDRRRFLRRAAACAAAPWVVPSAALGLDGATAASERIAVGLIGIGMMGQGHLRCLLGRGDAQVVAVCDVDRWRRENALKTVAAAYASRQPGGNYRGCEAYRDLRELLSRDDVDAVVIATGDNWHAAASVMAAEAGKDIYCEKPISKTIVEARAMVVAARRYDRVFQVGLQQRSTAEFHKACRLVRSGRIGAVKYVYVGFPGTNAPVSLPAEPVPEGLDWPMWLGPAPWRPFNGRYHHYGKPPFVVPWHFDPDLGGGNLTSNTVHAFDVVQWGLGMDRSGPVRIVPPESGQVPSLTYEYANGVTLQVDWKLDPAKHFVPKGWDVNTPIQHFGALFVGDAGWVHVGRGGFLQAFPEGLLERSADLFEAPYPTDHHGNWLESIRARRSPSCDVAVGARSTIVSHLGCIAHRTGRPLRWDPAQEEFVDDDQANRMRGRAMRAPWRV